MRIVVIDNFVTSPISTVFCIHEESKWVSGQVGRQVVVPGWVVTALGCDNEVM